MNDEVLCDLRVWCPDGMGNSNGVCFGEATDYNIVNRKRTKNPASVEVDERVRSESGSVVPPGGHSGSYRKTAAIAKYPAPPLGKPNGTDMNKNQTPQRITIDDDPDLNLALRKVTVSEGEVECFFGESPVVELNPTKSGSTTKWGTHSPKLKLSGFTKSQDDEDVFIPMDGEDEEQGPSSGNPTSWPRKTSTAKSISSHKSETNPALKTHMEVFSLKSPSEAPDDSFAHEAADISHNPQEVAHIDMTSFFSDQSVLQPENSIGVDNPSFSDVTSYFPDVSSSEILVIDATAAGKVNNAFDVSNEAETDQKQYIRMRSKSTSPEIGGSDSDDLLDENYYFFGMESLKFPTKEVDERVEADREIGEILGQLETIEDEMWTVLKPPPVDDVPDSARSDQVAQYEGILDVLRDVCNKVEDVLRKKGVNTTDDEINDDWLKLPDFAFANNQYDKNTAVTQTDVARRLVDAAENDDEAKVKDILEDYKRQQEKLLRMREAERRQLLESMKAKMELKKSRDNAEEQSCDDDIGQSQEEKTGDSDEERLTEVYTELIQDGDSDENEDYDIPSSEHSASESEISTEPSTMDDDSVDINPEAARTLRMTLANDIKTNMADMTSADFQSIMDIYRNERHGIRDVRDAEKGRFEQSLWDKMAARRRHVDESIHDGSFHESNEDPHEITLEGAIHVEPVSLETDHNKTSHVESSVSPTVESPSAQEYSVSDQKVVPTSANIELHDSQPEGAIPDAQQSELSLEDEDSLEKECMSTLGDRKHVTEDDLQKVLDQFVQSKESLDKQRSHQKSAMSERLKMRLAEKLNMRKESLPVEADESEPSKVDRETHSEVVAMDEAFYKSLVARKAAGSLTDAELTDLIEDHLDQVEQFRRIVRQQMSKRRKERRRVRSSDVSDILEEDRKNREQVQRMRKEERSILDERLQEKLRKKKQQKSPDVRPVVPPKPPPKPKRKKDKSRDADQQQTSSYENVGFDI